MKHLLMTVLAVMLSMANAAAQVENRSLMLTGKGKVECGILPEMNCIHSYTVQLWFKPTQWTAGAILIERGNMRVALGDTNGKLAITVNGTECEVESPAIAAGQWQQLTFFNSMGRVKVLIDRQKAGSWQVDDTGADMDTELTIGGNGYEGLIDEVRIWNKALDDSFDYFWNNTLNEFNQQLDNLIVYYKMDHEEWTESLVDYKSLWTGSPTNHHGVITGGEFVGVDRRSADQTHVNTKLPYLLNGGYTNNERFFDRGIPCEQYLLSNDIICLSILSWNNGHLDYYTPVNHATINGTAEWVDSHEGRNGVLKLDGEGSMTSPASTLNNASSYTIEGWINMDDWVEGASILHKGDFNVCLGSADTQELIVNVGQQQYVYDTKLNTAGWHYLGISPNGTAFTVVVDGSQLTAKASGNSITLPQTDAKVVWGEGLKAHIDQWAVWNRTFNAAEMTEHSAKLPMPGLGTPANKQILDQANSLYLFDEQQQPGYDYYSQDNWLRIMKSAFEGYRGYQFRISVYSHTDWEKTLWDSQKRQNFADDLARLSAPYTGVELDLEWVYYDSWETFGDLIDQIRDALPKEKTLMVSCHNVTYKFLPANRIPKVDGFTMQQYGPQKAHYTYASCVNAYDQFLTRYPKEKIYLSWATTTTSLLNNNESWMGDIAGVNWGAMPEGYETGDDMDRWERNGGHHYFMTPKQVYKRAKFAQDKDCQGIFYWDMANDYRIDHKYCLARYATYGLNANVDRIVNDATPAHATATGTAADDPNQDMPVNVELCGKRVKSEVTLKDGAYVAWLCGDASFDGQAWIGCGDRYDHSEEAESTPLSSIFRLDNAGGGCFYLYNMTNHKYVGHATTKSTRGDFYDMVWCDDTSDSRVSRMSIKKVNATGNLYLPATAAYMFNIDDKAHSDYSSLKVGDTEANFGYLGTNSWKVWLMYTFNKDEVEQALGIAPDALETPHADNGYRQSRIYDLMGRPVYMPAHGVYILNGKKYMVK